MTFEKFVSKFVKAVDELEKLVRGMHNADIVETIWQRVSNAELSQYLTSIKVQFQHQTSNYREYEAPDKMTYDGAQEKS